MADTPDPAASALDPIRADLRTAADGGLIGVKAGDYLPAALARHSRTLLAAVEAALKASDRWATEAARLDKLAMAEADPQSCIAISLRAQALEDCARELRGITTALTENDSAPAGAVKEDGGP